ncbi:MAG TPA: hypothetical protein VFQ44_05715 [Streptosporangiaceae bacterium]|nr:hypothetical protein [Streptosporangiaceae bacterium]
MGDVGGRKWIESQPDELAGQREIMLRLLDWSESDARVKCLGVACSVGRGAGDRLSDLDMGMWLETSDFEAVVADIHRAVDAAGELIESYHHKLPGVTIKHERIFAQYADRCQLDLVVMPTDEGLAGVKDFVLLYNADGLVPTDFEHRPVTPIQVREWAFNGWACLADVGKYLRRGSPWEALERLHQARAEFWRLLAASYRVPNPQYGVTSILDFAPDRMPAELAGTVAPLDLDGLLAAARALASRLSTVGDLLDPELSATLPTAMAAYVTADLDLIETR